jgi:hypothetical protein
MEEQQQSIRFAWVKTIVLTALASFSIEVVLMLYDTLGGSYRDPSDLVPWTFYSLWAIAALGGVAWVVYKLKAKVGRFFTVMFIGSIISAVAWIFIPDSLKILEANYYGVESRITMDMHEEGRYDETTEYDLPLELGFMYHRDSPELKHEIREKAKRNEYVDVQGFLTWQTGLAYGFMPDPVSIPQYNGCDNFRERLSLIMTVGPVVLSEMFIRGMYGHFLVFLIAQIIFVLIRKEHVWWAK